MIMRPFFAGVRLLLAAMLLAGLASPAAVAAPIEGGEQRVLDVRTPAPPSDDSIPDAYVPGEVLVRFEIGTLGATRRFIHERVGGVSRRSFQVVPGLELVRLRPGVSVAEALKGYGAMASVRYAQPNYVKRLAAVPDDTYQDVLWGLHNTGQTVNGTTGTADADIDAREAWEITTGSSDIVIAVIDTGIDYNHPDLAANMWVNPGEIPGNGIDDDGNGYVDDVHGWNAVADNGNPMDDHGHGTHCAGTIGAAGNNGRGVVGVNWDVSLMAVKMLNASGIGTTANAIECFEYIEAAGAHLSSNSWGGSYPFDQAEYDAIAAVDKLFVFAAGNDGKDIDSSAFHPAAYDLDNILSVGASNSSDARASFSNYGATRVDVFAPGVNILSTIRSKLAIANDATVNTIFADDFTTLSAWYTSSLGTGVNPWKITNTAYVSSPSSVANIGYINNQQEYIDQVSPLDLSAADYPGVRFKWRYDLEPNYDFAFWGIYDAAAGTYPILGYVSGDSGGVFKEVLYDLGAYSGRTDIYLWFGMYTNGSYNSAHGYDGVWVDDVEVFDLDPGAGSPWTYDDSTAYAYYNGTSMATPHVAGIAGLLLAEKPSLNWSQIKSALMDTVDVKVSLTDLCVSDGRVNARSALESLNTAPVAADDGYTTTEDMKLTVGAPGVLANDTDADGDTLSAALVDDAGNGELTLTADGSFEYVPDAGWFGTDTFSYTANDGTADSNIAVVTIEVISSNTAPVLDPIADKGVDEGALLSFTATASDADIPAQTLTFALGAGAPAGAAITAGGAFTWTPSEAQGPGSYDITVTVTDGEATDSGTFTVTVAEVNDPEPLPPVIEIAGSDRFATAVEASLEAYPDGLDPAGAQTVVVTTGRNWPDALGGSALAGVLDGPLLLTEPGSLPAVVTDEIERLGAEKAVILGGEAAVSPAVKTALEGLLGAGSVERISGADRYQTADKVALRVISLLGTDYDGTAFVATGGNFPDALGASPLAAANGWPLYLAHPTAGLSVATKAAMAGVDEALILGGTAVIGPETEAWLLGVYGKDNVTRLAGADRYETAAKVAAHGVDHGGLIWNRVAIATGVNFPDALAGGVLQGKVGSVMLLTRPTALDPFTQAALTANKADITTVTFFGGTGALPETVRNDVLAALE